MIEPIGTIVQRTITPRWIIGMVQQATEHRAGDPQSRDTNSAKGVKTVSILNDRRFRSRRSKTSRERMRLDRVADRINPRFGDSKFSQKLTRLVRRAPSGLSGNSTALWKLDDIVKPARRFDDDYVDLPTLSSFSLNDSTRIGDDTTEMQRIVGGVVALTALDRVRSHVFKPDRSFHATGP